MTKYKRLLILVLGGFLLFLSCSLSREEQNVRGNADHVSEREDAFPGKDILSGKKDLSKNDKELEDNAAPKDNTVSPETGTQVPEVNVVVEEILEKMTKDLTGNYQMDDSFLLWLAERYEGESLNMLQQAIQENPQRIESWYEITGNSIHVLWVEYCRDVGIDGHYLDKVYEKECSDGNQVVMDFTGDINLAEGWSTTRYLDEQGGEIRNCFSDALWEEMQSADILMINNEFVFSSRGAPLAGKAYTFRADPQRIHSIVELGADVLSLANNHVYDYGDEALLDTLETIEEANIPYVGAGRNLEEAMKPVYFIANGRKIAIVSATQIERSMNYTKEATDEAAGVLKTLNPDKFLSVIETAKALSDYVVVFVHWGTENTNNYEDDQVNLGQKFIDAGADAVIGGHTHCLQGFDYYNGKPVVYSLGNYWFNNRTIDTGLLQLIIHTDKGGMDFRFLPCIQRGCVTSMVEDEGEKQRILNFMQRISAWNVSVGEDGIITEVP